MYYVKRPQIDVGGSGDPPILQQWNRHQAHRTDFNYVKGDTLGPTRVAEQLGRSLRISREEPLNEEWGAPKDLIHA